MGLPGIRPYRNMVCTSQILALSAQLEDFPEAERKDVLAAYHRFLVSIIMPLCARHTRRLEDMQVMHASSLTHLDYAVLA